MSTTLYLCVSSYCGLPGQHTDDCEDPESCRGCLPAVAADGLWLCELCVRRIAKDAWSAAWRYAALGVALTGAGRSGDAAGAVAKDPGLDLSPAVLEAREAIRSTMLGIVSVIAAERGVSPPWRWHLVPVRPLPEPDPEPGGRPTRLWLSPTAAGPPNRVRRPDLSPPGVARFIGVHARWLASHRHAARWAGQLRDLVTDHRTMRLSFPSASDRLFIGECPLRTSSGAVCGARLYQLPDEVLVTCRGCGQSETVEWWQRQLTGAVGGVVDAYAAAAYLSVRWARPVGPATIREWGRGRRAETSGVAPLTEPDPADPAGEARRVRRDAKARAQYDLAALTRYATRLWGEPPRRSRRRARRAGSLTG